MRRIALPALFLSSLLIALLPAAASAKTVKLTSKANGKTVKLRTGDTLKVALGENGTTPYQWSVTKRSAQSVLKSAGSRYKPYKQPPMTTGGGGTRTYTWKAVGAGETTTRLALTGLASKRDVLERFRLRVVVSRR